MRVDTSNPKCPHCDHEYDDDQTWHRDLDTSDGAENEADCPICRERFIVRVSTVTVFESLTPADAYIY